MEKTGGEREDKTVARSRALAMCPQCRRSAPPAYPHDPQPLCVRCLDDWIRYLPITGPRASRIYRDRGRWYGVVTGLDGVELRGEPVDAMHQAWTWCRAHDGSDPNIREVTARKLDPVPYVDSGTVINGTLPKPPPPPPRAIQQPTGVDGGPLKMGRCKACRKLMHKCQCAAELGRIERMRLVRTIADATGDSEASVSSTIDEMQAIVDGLSPEKRRELAALAKELGAKGKVT